MSGSIKNITGSSQSLTKQTKKFLGSTQSLNVKCGYPLFHIPVFFVTSYHFVDIDIYSNEFLAFGKKIRKLGGSKKHLGAGLAGSRESLATSDFELSDREKFSSVRKNIFCVFHFRISLLKYFHT